MNYITFDRKSGIKVPKVGNGTWQAKGKLNGSRDQVIGVTIRAKEVGVNLAENAELYGFGEPVASEEPLRTGVIEYRRTLLVVNAKTTKEEVEEALASSRSQSRLPLVIIYNSRLTLLSEGKTEGEVDLEFTYRLNYGKNLLENISTQAKRLGFSRVETRFIWGNVVSELINRIKEPGDQVIDLTRTENVQLLRSRPPRFEAPAMHKSETQYFLTQRK